MVRGEPAEHLFKKDDLKAMDIVDREEVTEELKKEAEKAGDKAFGRPSLSGLGGLKIIRVEPDDDPPNFARADEE